MSVQTKEAQEARARPYHALGMDSLARLIVLDRDEEAGREWADRYGHEFPVYAVVADEARRYER